MTEADADRLLDAYRREARSLLLYARGADPYAGGADRKLRDDLFRMADETAAALGDLAAFLDTNRVPLPGPAAFPVVFTDLNFIAVRNMLPRVEADRGSAVAALEADLAALSDPVARAALQPLLDLTRRHRDALAAGV